MGHLLLWLESVYIITHEDCLLCEATLCNVDMNAQ